MLTFEEIQAIRFVMYGELQPPPFKREGPRYQNAIKKYKAFRQVAWAALKREEAFIQASGEANDHS